LELLDTLVDANLQNERELKLEDINLLFINLHHLINEFRPHQICTVRRGAASTFLK